MAGATRGIARTCSKQGRSTYHRRVGIRSIAKCIFNPVASAGMSGGPNDKRKRRSAGVLFASSGSVRRTSSRTVKNRCKRSHLPSGLRTRVPPAAGCEQGSSRHEFTLNGPWDLETFVFDESSGVPITIEFETYEDVEYASSIPTDTLSSTSSTVRHSVRA